ncbi:MAG: NAD(P)H-dependent oxidoreductase [Lachnospiraceae bacterium]|nr:NAD(P)H-dependent oxidoreductase [Lachnospiraceae bacterium]
MNILVINGSPKGKYSITLQTVLYLEKCFPEHTFQILHAGQQIKALQKDFSVVVKELETADLILFSYPVYTFIAPSQLHRFIELVKASGADLAGKFVTQITTSKHFYDVTAHRYIQDNCQDMGMKFVKGLSADMDDLLTVKGQKEAKRFFRYVQWCMKKDSYEPIPKPLGPAAHVKVHVPEEALKPLDTSDAIKSAGKEKEMLRGKQVVIVTDCRPQDDRLRDMIARFQKVLPLQSRVVNIREYPFIGGCLGCFNCAVSGKCIYKDGFDDFLRNDIQSGAAIIYAFTIQDHSMGAAFKQYDDRQFCNGHRTVTMGMPMGYLISGDYSKEFNLQMIIEGRAEVGGNFLAGVATDETDPDAAIDRLAKTCVYAIRHRYVQPQNFYGVGGMKIFRDLIYLMQGMMKADHQFYKQHGQYDFPQKKKGTLVKMYLVGALLSSPKIKAKMGNKMNEGMLMPYKKLLEK